MAKGYRPVLRDQLFLLPPDMGEWLPDDHPVRLVIRVVEKHLDTSGLHGLRRAGGAGAAGFDPVMLAELLIWAYANGVTSSRRIEQLCGTDVAYRVICAGDAPDHCVIARFRADLGGAVSELFAQVLVLCAQLGMGRLGVVTLDGTKVAANASKSANRGEARLRELAAERVAAHVAADAEDDALFGAGRGDEVPAQAWSPRSRDSRIAAALASLEAGREAAEAERQAAAQAHVAAAAAGTPLAGHRPAEADVRVAELNLARIEAAQQARAQAWERRRAERAAAGLGPGKGRRPSPENAKVRRARDRLASAIAREQARQDDAAAKKGEGPGPVRNLTDPDSRLMPTRNGFLQGYNPQNVVTGDGLIIATELTDDTGDVTWLEPMLTAAEAAAALITAHQPPGGSDDSDDGPGSRDEDEGGDDSRGEGGDQGGDQNRYRGPIGLLLADAGYLSEHNLTCPGPDRLIATGKHRNLEKAARHPPGPASGDNPGGQDSGAVAKMTARLATPDGITTYRQRGHIAETPHGHIKHNMGFRQFTMRGKAKAKAEWTLACTVHNLFKAITTGHLTSQALTALAS